MSGPTWECNGVRLWWREQGVVLSGSGTTVVVDPGDGLAWAATERLGLPPIEAVLFTAGTPARIGGLYGLLAAEARRPRKIPLTLVHSLSEEGVPALAAAWRQSDPRSGDLVLAVEPLFHGDGLSLRGGGVVAHDVGGLAFQLSLDGAVVVCGGGAGPSGRLSRLLRGAQVAVLDGPGHDLPSGCLRVGPDAP